MEKTSLTFDQLPAYIYQLGRKVDDLTALIRAQKDLPPNTPDRWLSVTELSEYLPGKPAITTIYGKIQKREIPFYRQGKWVAFLQSEIDLWMQGKYVKTAAELDMVADRHISHKHRREGRKA